MNVQIAASRTEIGHWEFDTVIGQRAGKEAVVFTAVEKATRHYISIKIPGRNSAGIEMAMNLLLQFTKVF